MTHFGFFPSLLVEARQGSLWAPLQWSSSWFGKRGTLDKILEVASCCLEDFKISQRSLEVLVRSHSAKNRKWILHEMDMVKLNVDASLLSNREKVAWKTWSNIIIILLLRISWRRFSMLLIPSLMNVFLIWDGLEFCFR